MAYADFVHLRVHSAYSLSSGAIKIKNLVALCRRHAMPAVAIADSGNLFGALEFAMAAAEAGVQPIIGGELGIRRAETEGGRAARIGPALPPDAVVLLAQSEAGYRNLLKLVSKSHLETAPGEAPQLDLAAFEGRTEGLICLAGGPKGPVGRLIGESQAAAAEALLARLADLFPGRLYVELQRHNTAAEERIDAALIELALAHGLPLVATNDVHFAERDDYAAHDVLLCIAQGTTLADGSRKRLTPEHYFKSANEMRIAFADVPEACDNTLAIARRCAFMPEPRQPILPPFTSASGRDEAAELRGAAGAGLERRLAAQVFKPEMSPAEREAAAAPYRERLAYELDVIVTMGFAGYFLIVAEFIQWAKAQGIPVGPGRGSGAGSLVAWSLTITDLDPLRLGLVFERFLNPERVSMPDFDIDFCQDRRDEVIHHVQERYGADRVAQIITFGKLQARAVLRDVGRVLGMPYGQVDRICKLVPNNPAAPVTLQQAIDGEPMLQQMRDEDPQVARLIEIALQLEGLYRHASTHAAGVVIGDRPLDELVPLYRDPRSSMPVTQFSMKYVEAAGLVKFDFLGLKTLTVLAKARDLLAARGVTIDLSNLPLDDAKTFRLLARGETIGVFQLEGAGMRDTLKRLDADRFEDIVAVNALYRPGPMENIPRYIAVKHGNERPEYMHPELEPILEETQGIIIYQEQVMEIAKVLSGYSLGSADLLRRAMGKKIKSEMEAQRKQFIGGAKAHGVSDALAEYIFEQVAKFAGYGFNKSHAAAYALVGYQTAYLKANYPVEFMAASMTLDLGNTDKLNVFRQECDRLGIRLLAPDINRSDVGFAVEAAGEGGAIRYALAAIKGVGAAAMQQVITERAAHGPFKDLFDFAARIDPKHFNKRQFESLVKAGAFDTIAPNRAQAFAAIELLLRHANAAANERASQQVNLFGGDAGPVALPPLPAATDWPLAERLQKEFEAIGFYLSSHPLNPYGKSLARLGVPRFADLTRRPAGGETRVRLAGVVIGSKERTSVRGNRFAFLQVSDMSGVYEVMAFSEVLRDSRALIDSGQPLLLTADIRIDGDSFRLTAQRIEALDKVAAGAAAGLRLVVEEADALGGIRRAVAAESGGRGRVSVVVPLDETREVEIALPGGFKVTPRLAAALQTVPGIREVAEI
ncbi:MAG: DNA polymerase III subunit alpha [Alphaproteobacteria bacterium]|nr:DNA polymerase III subunit alpha [Alphaproteobacteria bacterium]